MIEEFTKAWFANLPQMRSKFTAKHPDDYKEVVRYVIEMLASTSTKYDRPDPERIHQIDDGEYQGTLVYVIGAQGYQPDRYWYVKVSYGSCSGCDTLQAISWDHGDLPTDEEVAQYMTLALHVLQNIREMNKS